MLPYCDKRKKSASHMLIKGEDRGGLRTAPDAREAEQMARCTQLKLKQV